MMMIDQNLLESFWRRRNIFRCFSTFVNACFKLKNTF